MARPREPIDLVIAKGKKHLTKSEIEERRSQEIDIPFKKIVPPKYLGKEQKKKFKEIAKKLQTIGIYTELDEDNLARYIIAQDMYVKYTEEINRFVLDGDINLILNLQSMQDKAYRQAQTCARDLGLTISSRCRLVVPKINEEQPKQNKFAKFKKGG